MGCDGGGIAKIVPTGGCGRAEGGISNLRIHNLVIPRVVIPRNLFAKSSLVSVRCVPQISPPQGDTT